MTRQTNTWQWLQSRRHDTADKHMAMGRVKKTWHCRQTHGNGQSQEDMTRQTHVNGESQEDMTRHKHMSMGRVKKTWHGKVKKTWHGMTWQTWQDMTNTWQWLQSRRHDTADKHIAMVRVKKTWYGRQTHVNGQSQEDMTWKESRRGERTLRYQVTLKVSLCLFLTGG